MTLVANSGSEPTLCRLCDSNDIEQMGPIPDSDFFAGRTIKMPIAGGQLWICHECRSMFRHPILGPSDYHRLYAEGSSSQWAGTAQRRDLQIIRAIVTRAGNARKVLDVGCGTGDFLISLPRSLLKFGLEPSIAAQVAATDRGLSVIAPSMEELASDAHFDLITIIDVIEHVADPRSLLRHAYQHLLPGGLIIVSTGDPENWFWRRLFRSRFWYAGFPEHITFPSRRFFETWSLNTGANRPAKDATRYQMLTFSQRAFALVMQCGYFLSPLAFHWFGRCTSRVLGFPCPYRRYFCPGSQGLFLDHQVLTIRRPGADE